MTIFAYIRVSTNNKNQTTDNQRKQIVDAGFAVDVWVDEDGISGSIDATDRPAFSKMNECAKSGDTIIVTMVDRLGRRAADILRTVDSFKERGIKIRVLQFDGLDVTGSTGKLVITVMAACAELERNLLVERTVAGLARTKAQGTKLGQPMRIDADTYENIVFDIVSGESLSSVARKYDYPKATVHKNYMKWGKDVEGYRNEYNVRTEQYAASALKKK